MSATARQSAEIHFLGDGRARVPRPVPAMTGVGT